MTSKILVPVDLEHADKLDKGLKIAASIAKSEGATVCFLGVTSVEPTKVAANPTEYAGKLEAFAQDQSKARGIDTSSKAVTVHDTAVELSSAILEAAKEFGADLIVMTSHVPGLKEHLFSTNAGYIANHAPVSVYVVR